MRIVGGKYRGKKILSPLHGETRPTSDRTRETIFNVLLHNPNFGPYVLTDKVVLDVFAGTGAFGLEAFSRGSKTVHFIENDKDMLPILQQNVKAFGLPSSSVKEEDAQHFRCPSDFSYDVVFLDPPYQTALLLPTIKQLFDQNCLAVNAPIVMEMAKDESFTLPSFSYL